MAKPIPERRMTKRDWEALYLVMRLQEAIVLHGAEQLGTFIDAMVELRCAPTEPTEESTRG